MILVRTGSAGTARPQSAHRRALSVAAKRVLDLGFVLALLPLALPLMAILALTIRRDGGPAFFGHARIGRHGRTFRCWKLRTMVPDAEAALAAHLAADRDAAAEWARDYKLTDDPRVTRLGRFLRRTSLDELPQLLNVARGDMSVVGPRPVTVAELSKYDGFSWVYLAVKPGLTGLWQVSGRNDVDYAARVALDVDYHASRSFVGDVAIIARTGRAVLARTGR